MSGVATANGEGIQMEPNIEEIHSEEDEETSMDASATPLWKYVTKLSNTKSKSGGGRKWICKFGCKKEPYTGSYARVKAHLIGTMHGQRRDISLCSKVGKEERELLKKEEMEATNNKAITDVAGEILEVGPGVQTFKAGDKVISMLNFWKGGGLAEYAVASANVTVNRPSEVSAAEGAGLPIAACTALQALKSGGAKFDGTSKPGNVLITAASGGVGTYAVQLAKLAGLHVTATCGARNVDLVKSLGADEVLDYKTPEGASLKSPSGTKYDSVVHCTVGISWSTFEPNLSANGKVIDITPSPGMVFNSVLKKLTFAKKKVVPLLLVREKEEMEFLVGLMKEGKLKTVLDSTHPLSKAEEAWAKSMDGHATGKVVVVM